VTEEKPEIPELPVITETETAEPEEPEILPEPTEAELYTEFFRQYYESVDPETDWDNAAYFIALPDLDFNGIPELIVEKAGASASSLLEIYTIEEGEVRTLGNSRLDLPRAKNAVDFWFEGSVSDFNIHEYEGGSSVYLFSRNGAMDMEYSTLLRLASIDGALGCEIVTSYRAEVTDWTDYNFDTAVWDGTEYTYDEFESLYRAWLSDVFYQEHPVLDAGWMDERKTQEIGNTDEMLALIEEICG